MRIVMIVWNEFKNDARVLKEAETLQYAGYQVVVHALHTPGVTCQNEVYSTGVKVVRVPRSPLWKWRKSKSGTSAQSTTGKKIGAINSMSLRVRVLRILARLWTHAGLAVQMIRAKPDVVHAHDVNTLPTAWFVAVISRSPLIYDAHEISTDREGYASFRNLVAWVEKHLMPRAFGTITTTRTRSKFFARAYNIPRPLVLQNRPRLASVTATDKIRNELELKQDWPIVLYQGGLQQGRGLERLVRSAEKVENAYFVFIGGGRLEGKLKALVEELELSSRVFFIPTVPLSELPYYTASADIGVQPIENTCLNHFSTDSNKLFEYIIAGLPVISSDLPEIRKVVRENEIGLLVPPGDTSALINAISTLVDNEKLRNIFHSNSKSAAETLNWESQEEELLTLYNKISA